MTEYFGEAPGHRRRRASLTKNQNHCTTFHADDEDYFSKVYYWTTPVRTAATTAGEVCKDYSETGRPPGRRSAARPVRSLRDRT